MHILVMDGSKAQFSAFYGFVAVVLGTQVDGTRFPTPGHVGTGKEYVLMIQGDKLNERREPNHETTTVA